MIKLVTANSVGYSRLAAITAPGKQQYCDRWGFTFSHQIHPDPVTCWDRPRIWFEELNTSEWIFWTGCDVLITNHTIDVRKFMTDDVDFVFAADGNGLQCDVFLLRSTPDTRAFMSRVLNHRYVGTANEQDALNIELSGAKNYSEFCGRVGNLKQGGEPPAWGLIEKLEHELQKSLIRVRIVPQRELNAYPHRLYGGTGEEPHSWMPGDFILHAPGIPLDKRLETFPHFPVVH